MRPGAVLAPEYTSENLELLAAGCCNMQVSVQWHYAWALRVCVCVAREKRWYERLRFLLHPPIIDHPSPRLTPPPSSTPLSPPQHHVRNAAKFGVRVVVAVNRMTADTDAEIAMVQKFATEAGAFGAVESTHWADGGAGAVALAEKIVECCAAARADEVSTFKFLYPIEMPLALKVCNDV